MVVQLIEAKPAENPTLLWLRTGPSVKALPDSLAGYACHAMAMDDFRGAVEDGSANPPVSAILLDLQSPFPSPLRLLAAIHVRLSPGGKLYLRHWGSHEDPCLMESQSGEEATRYLARLASHAGYSLPYEQAGLLTLDKAELPRWQTQSVSETDVSECRELFHRVFKGEISPAFWEWKYGGGRGHSILARRDNGSLAAHYGATCRDLLFLGRETRALQIGDVMVDPPERGVFTRRGVFFQVARTFQECHFGFERKFQLAYGFPNARAMRVAERLGLYAEADRLTELRWVADSTGSGGLFAPVVERLSPSSKVDALVDGLWRNMSKAMAPFIVVKRDAAYFHYRYLAHPEHNYDCFLVKKRITRAPLGVFVLARGDGHVRLMDVICGPTDIQQIIGCARKEIAGQGFPELVGWVASSQLEYFLGPECEQRSTDILIPEHAWTPGVPLEKVRGRWWVSMGDTDFL